MTLERDFEKFKGGPTLANRDRIHITINRKGIILLNANAYRLLGKPTAVNLYYSRHRDTIAVEPSHPRLPMVFPIKVAVNRYMVYASPFCKHYGIKIDATHAFVRPDIDDGLLILNLGEIIKIGGWTRKKKP